MDEELLTAAEVAAVFRTTPKTINKWARDGDIVAIVLPGGDGLRTHRRFRRSDIERMMNELEAKPA